MPNINLQDINDAADRKYGPFVVAGVPGGDVALLNVLRMPKANRAKLKDLDKVAEGEDPLDEFERLSQIIALAAVTPADGKRLLKAIGDDLGRLAVLVTEYTQASQLGEASPSAS